MKQEDANYVLNKIENEGMDYCFMHYSSFKDINDQKFHELRQDYLNASKALKSYLEEQNGGEEIPEE